MKMKNNELNHDEKKTPLFDFTFFITGIISLLPILIGIILWDKLPQEMVRHMNVNMEPDGWSSKETVVFVFPVILFCLNVFVNLLINITRRIRKTKSSKVDKVIKIFIPIFSLLICTIIDLLNIDSNPISPEKVWTLSSLACVVLFMGIGNYIPKAKDLTGISLPGISDVLLKDEDMWFFVRRKWSRIIFIICIPMIVTSFIPTSLSIFFFMIWTLLFAFTPYILVAIYKKKQG